MPARKATPDFHSIIKQVASDYHTKLVSQGIGADDPIEWIQTEFYIPERSHEKNKAMQLAPHQIAVLQEAYRKDSRGKFVYDVICWSDIKKSGKSSIAAAVLLERARRTEWGTFKIVANDLKQADSRVFYYIRRAIEMNPRLSAIATISNYKIILPNKSIIEAIPVDPKGEAGGNDDFIEFTELHAATSKAAHKMWCYDDQTEILTRRGWINGVDLTLDDYVATVTPETHIFEWEKPKALYREPYKGEMHLYENERFSECVTPNHRLYGIFSHTSKKSKYIHKGIMRSDDLRNGHFDIYHPLTNSFGYSGYTPKDVTLPQTKFKPSFSIGAMDLFEYLGWYLSEGNIKHNNKRPVTSIICQSPTANPQKWTYLKDFHDRVFGEGKWRLGERDTCFRVDSAPFARYIKELVGTGTREKFIPDTIKDADTPYLQALLNAYIRGDGHVTKIGTIQLPIGNKRLSDDIQEIAFKLGYTVSVGIAMPKKAHWHTYYRLVLAAKRDGYAHEIARRYDHWKTVDYDGLVWCPSTKNGLLVVRRKGKVYVSGNTELTLSPLKAGYSQRWIDTYAGFTGESPILEPIYEQCVRRENLIDLGIPDLEVYRKGKILCYWNTQPRLAWQTPEYYASEAQVLSPNEFARVHRNQWVTSVEQFVPPEWWYACEKPSLPPLDRWRQVVVALDAAVSDDCFGMIAVSRDDDRITVRFVRAWYPNNGKITFSNPDDPNDLSTPEGQLRQLAKDYNVVGVVYDPTQLHDFCTRLRHDNVAGFREFNQNITRLIADKQLRDLIRERRIIHNGDVTLTEHINNANAKADTEDSKLRIVKRTQGAKIDLAVCLSMASYHALRVLT